MKKELIESSVTSAIRTQTPGNYQRENILYICIAVFTLDAGLLARSQYSEGTATATSTHVFLGFPVSISKC